MFKCLKCGFSVEENNLMGSKNRNHCPFCLYSLHVDLSIPGDRKSNCFGLMKPTAIAFKKDGEIMLVHECLKCGSLSKNRIAGDDDPKEILKIEDSEEIRTALFGKPE